MKNTTLIAAILATTFAGCETASPTAKAVFRLGLRAAVYAVVSNNPEIKPYVSTMGAVFAAPGGTVSPEKVQARVNVALDEMDGLDATQRALLAPLVTEALTFYADVYEANLNNLEQSDYLRILTQIGETMQAAVEFSVDGPADAFVMDTPRGVVQIE